jgi:hypothetical protein
MTKRQKCRHKNADHLIPGELFMMSEWAPPDAVHVIVEQFRCLDCGFWLSLGPSSDDTPQVQLEIAAARIVADGDLDGFLDDWGCPLTPDCSVCNAYRLASEIMEHGGVP